MSSPIERAVEKVPSNFLVYSLVSGLLFLYLSPLRIYCSWIIDPISLKGAETLAYFLVIIIYSVCIGTPLFFAYSFVAGNQGLFSRLMRMLRQKKDDEKKEDPLEFLRFVQWLNKSSLLSHAESVTFYSQIINALIVGSAVAFLFDSAFFIVSLGGWFVCRSSDQLFLAMGFILQCLYSLGVLVLLVVYNSKYFRSYITNEWDKLRQLYLKEKGTAK